MQCIVGKRSEMDNVNTTAGHLRSERMDIDILIDADLVSLDYV